MANPTDARIEQIDMDGKQLLIVTGATVEEVNELGKQLKEFMDSDRVLFLICLQNGTEVRLEKIDTENYPKMKRSEIWNMQKEGQSHGRNQL